MTRKPTIPSPGPGEALALVPGIIVDRTSPTAATIDQVRKATHDRVILQTGPLRRSGVWWTTHYAADARRLIDEYVDESDPQRAEMLEMMANPRAVLVVAWVVTKMPAGRN